MSKQNRATAGAGLRAFRLITCVLAVVAVGSVVVYLSLGQAPPAAAQGPVPNQPRVLDAPPGSVIRYPHTEVGTRADGAPVYQTTPGIIQIPDGPGRVNVLNQPPQTETDRRSLALAARLRQTEDAEEQERLRSELTELLGKAFDQRQKLQQQEMERLESRLQSIRELDQRRQELKDKIVQRRLDQLLGKGDELAWETSPPVTIGSTQFYSPAPPQQTFIPPYPGSIYPGPGPFHRDAYANARPKDDDPIRDRAADGRSGFQSLPRLTTPEQHISIRGEQSLDLAERILTLATEAGKLRNNIASVEKALNELEAQAGQLQPGTQDAYQATYEQSLTAYRRSLLDAETKLRLAQVAWQGLGTQLEREYEGTQRQLRAAEQQVGGLSQGYRGGDVTRLQMDEAKAAVEAADSKTEIAASRLRTWKESDGILQQRLKAILDGE